MQKHDMIGVTHTPLGAVSPVDSKLTCPAMFSSVKENSCSSTVVVLEERDHSPDRTDYGTFGRNGRSVPNDRAWAPALRLDGRFLKV